VTAQQVRAQNLLLEWHGLRNSGVCAYIFDIQESKDRLESLSALLSVELYCSPDNKLNDICGRFENELEQLKYRVHKDLIAGLQTTKTK
jgi:hypothetical protein